MISMMWAPVGVLGLGCLLNFSVSKQRELPLRAPLTTLPTTIATYRGEDVEIDPRELRVAGTTTALLRFFTQEGADPFSVYVGYYPSQRQGSTIHSPKNCLPGAGWEPLLSRPVEVQTPAGVVRANRFIIAKKTERALVYYWYQGRGRTESNEYRVKIDLIRDAALKRRSEEALVRILIPLTTQDEAAADALIVRIISELKPGLNAVFPT